MDLFFVYVVCFGVGLLFTIITGLMANVFGGHDVSGHVGAAHTEGTGGHAEAGPGNNDMPGFASLSPTTLAVFITAFGGFGMVFSKTELVKSPWISVPLSALGGLVTAALVLALFRFVFRRTQSSSEVMISRLVGTNGTVITPIPSQGVGEIAYVSGGSRYTAPARTVNGSSMTSGQPVRIARIVGSDFYVEPL